MSASSDTSIEPNLTPILDMVFQLITFFMLVVNFKGGALDMSLELPVLGSARPLDTNGVEAVMVINLDSEGVFKLYGNVMDLKSYIEGEARLEVAKMQKTKADFQAGQELPTMVAIRADRRTPFHVLNNAIKTCQEYGYRKFSLNAMNRSS
jgi:biopolymer transport protein ExbD